VRARINVLSELPDDWAEAVQRWSFWNRDKKIELDGSPVPHPNEEYLLYQTLIGAWSLEPMDESSRANFIERIERYIEKALKEAKLHTSWISPNESYDQGVRNFVRSVLSPTPDNQFLIDFVRFQNRITYAASVNSLAQALLKIISPGVPDFYQGTELWDFSLVDPDNRRAVDFTKRAKLLRELQRREPEGLSFLEELLAQWKDGRVKQYLIYKSLQFRRTQEDLFLEGDYIPLSTCGDRREHIVAFARTRTDRWVVVAVPRLLAKASLAANASTARQGWEQTHLNLPQYAPTAWMNVLTSQTLSASTQSSAKLLCLQDALRHFPVALLSGQTAP
jgi:(1->4)-alpha-D-glucan 1-alpha-D-glucosylmutase